MTETSTKSLPGVIVAGAGHLGSYHLDKIATLQEQGLARLAGVVDTDEGKRQSLGERLQVPTAGKLDELECDAKAIVIATPTSTHVEIGHQALDRGLHILLEKPIATDVQKATELVHAARDKGLVLQVGHTERFNPAVAAALKISDRPHYIVAERLGPFTGRSTDIDVVLDLMIHDLDIVLTLVDSELTEVRAIGVPVLTHEVDMTAARLAFANGTVAQLSAGRASLEPSRKIRLFTVERYLSIDCQAQEVKSVRRLPPAPDSKWPQISGEPVDVINGDALLLQDTAFVRAFTEGTAPVVSGEAGIKALKLAQAIKAQMTVPSPGNL